MSVYYNGLSGLLGFENCHNIQENSELLDHLNLKYSTSKHFRKFDGCEHLMKIVFLRNCFS